MSRMSGYEVRINTHTADCRAIVLLADGVLIGVVSELMDECHGRDKGKWAVESAFGIDDQAIPDFFESANDAANWLSTRIAGAEFSLDEPVPELH